MHGTLYRVSFGGQGCGSLSTHLHLSRGPCRCSRAATLLGSRAALGAVGALCRALVKLDHMLLRCDTARLSKQRLLKQARDASCRHTEVVWSTKETRHTCSIMLTRQCMIMQSARSMISADVRTWPCTTGVVSRSAPAAHGRLGNPSGGSQTEGHHWPGSSGTRHWPTSAQPA